MGAVSEAEPLVPSLPWDLQSQRYAPEPVRLQANASRNRRSRATCQGWCRVVHVAAVVAQLFMFSDLLTT